MAARVETVAPELPVLPVKHRARTVRTEVAAAAVGRAVTPAMAATPARLDSCCSGVPRESTEPVVPAAGAVTRVQQVTAAPARTAELVMPTVATAATAAITAPPVAAGSAAQWVVAGSAAIPVLTALMASSWSVRQAMAAGAVVVLLGRRALRAARAVLAVTAVHGATAVPAGQGAPAV